MSNLKKNVEELSVEINAFIRNALINEHDLCANLYTLKQYFLLAKGDFWSIFISMAGNLLESCSLKKYELEAAMSSASLPTSTELFERVQVRLLSGILGPSEQRLKGWDMLSLGYIVDTPLSVIISPDHLKQYQSIFAFLLHAYQIDWKLSHSWQSQIRIEHLLHKLNLRDDNLRIISLVRQRMFHFMKNLQSFLQFEKLDAAWKQLSNELSTSLSLTEFVAAHDKYLSNLLPSNLEKLNTMFIIMSNFCDHSKTHLDRFMKNLLEIEAFRKSVQMRIDQGQWGVDFDDHEVPFVPMNTEDIEIAASDFESHILNFLEQSSELPQSLLFCLQFNGYYASRVY